MNVEFVKGFFSFVGHMFVRVNGYNIYFTLREYKQICDNRVVRKWYSMDYNVTDELAQVLDDLWEINVLSKSPQIYHYKR